jgi:hypothetical protein
VVVKFSTRIAVTAAAVAGSLALIAPPSQAAVGNLVLTDSSTGTSVNLNNPPRGCVSGVQFDTVVNATNTYVTVYSGLNCQSTSLVVVPGSSPASVGARRSVFIPV